MLDGDRPGERPVHGQRNTPCLYGLHRVDHVARSQRHHGKDLLLMENHVESCHCWHCGGYGKVSYIRDGDVEDWGHCHDCDGSGELYRAKITQTTVIRAFLTQAKHALEDIDLMDSDLDQI
ncbi:hypothetical protein, partial [Hyphomonas sp.]|uniref:hypothetical protein n=1 Tax=Hyphomonas sp. TaxID=87 RepID=UPI0025C3CB8D